jgi:hypothetical protein
MSLKVIYLGEDRFNTEWLKGVTENQAVKMLSGHSKNQVRNAWKQANGFSVPKYDSEEKPTPKKTVKAKKKT